MASTCFFACNSYNFAWDNREDFGTDNLMTGDQAWTGRELGLLDGVAGIRFFVRSMIFAVVHLACKAVPRQHAR